MGRLKQKQPVKFSYEDKEKDISLKFSLDINPNEVKNKTLRTNHVGKQKNILKKEC